jgi:hypothetical protein
LNSIYRCATTTRDLFNKRIDLSRHILQSLDIVSKKQPNADGDKQRTPSLPSTASMSLIRLKDSVLQILRRIQRALQISCRGSIASGRDIISIHHPLHFNAPMLVLFNKVCSHLPSPSSPLFSYMYLPSQVPALSSPLTSPSFFRFDTQTM